MNRIIAYGFCGLAVTLLSAHGAVVVDPPLPITHRVTVQATILAEDDGLNEATAFGDAAQQTLILNSIDQIWAQAGIDIEFQFTLTTWNNSFALAGTAGIETRPQSDLATIFSQANSEGIWDPNPLVLNLFFVSVVPGFTPLSDNTAAGLATVGGNGIALFVGSNLLDFDAGQDAIAAVVAHEIGHNLGLPHIGSDLPNLMSPSGTTDQLDASQISSALASSYAVPIPEPGTVALLVLSGLLFNAVRTHRRTRAL